MMEKDKQRTSDQKKVWSCCPRSGMSDNWIDGIANSFRNLLKAFFVFVKSVFWKPRSSSCSSCCPCTCSECTCNKCTCPEGTCACDETERACSIKPNLKEEEKNFEEDKTKKSKDSSSSSLITEASFKDVRKSSKNNKKR